MFTARPDATPSSWTLPKAAYPSLQTIMSATQEEVARTFQRRQSLPHTQAVPLDFMVTLIVATK